MLNIKGITKSFNGLAVLENICCCVKENEIAALIGPSGCGKSTLLNIISKLETPDSGVIEGLGESVACVFQDNRLLPWRTVWENISLVKETEEAENIRSWIEMVGLSGFESYYPSQLSGGMQKRCGLARAFYYKSDLLLMDEPFQGLDYYLRQEMLSILLKLRHSHKKQSILFVTHEIDDALIAASKILVFSKRPGKILKEIVLPGKEGRNPASEELAKIKREILSLQGLYSAPV